MTQSTPDPSQSQFGYELGKILIPVRRTIAINSDMAAYSIEAFMQDTERLITQAVKQLVEGIIGEDETWNGYSKPEDIRSGPLRNSLRAEQRAALLHALEQK